MIQAMQPADLDAVAGIWLDANLQAHHFIPARYWRDHFAPVKEQLAQAEVYVFAEENEILGFVGLSGDYIAGIFVRSEARSRGVGKELLDFVKQTRPRLNLSVYQKNEGAVRFYRREGFAVQREGVDEPTGEREYFMCWESVTLSPRDHILE